MKCLDKCLKSPEHFGAVLLRVAFGLLFVLVAVKKFRMGYAGFAEGLVGGGTLSAVEIPNVLLLLYGYVLPALEFVVGVLLLVNKYTRHAFIAAGLVYLSFIFGQMYDGNTAKIGTEYMPSMIALVLAYYLHCKVYKK